VTIRASDRDASERFYETVLRTLGIEQTDRDEEFVEWDDFSLASAGAEKPVTAAEAGYRDNGAPGERPMYHPGYYGAYVLDADGNNVEVVNHNR